ncbi:MAG: EAL domain-containing protein [Gammaproteobacteria bacterium]|nr:EAL domain-containing protein [Gammaproteobacteria bacterium]MBU1968792.1 EAL domain-containing protein [Gammaproteobacteria bacterium]
MPQAQALDEVTLQLKWLHQFQFAGYYMAEELGYYREAGLKVQFVEGKPGSDIVANVLEGKAEFGVGTSDLLLQRKEGKPVVVLGVVFQHSPFVLMARNTGSIHDLHGKRLMIDPYANELLAYLQKEGITHDRRSWTDYHYDPQSLIGGRIDAMSGYITDEPYYLDKAGVSYQLYTPRSGGIDFYGDNLFTTEQQIKDYPQRVQAFQEASMRGWKYAMAHPEEAIDLILTKYSRRQTRPRLQFEARNMAPLIQAELVDIGYMNPGRWKHIADTYADLGLLPGNFPLQSFLYDPHPQLDLTWLYRSLAFLLLAVVSVSSYLVLRSNRRLKLANRKLVTSEEYGRKRLTQTRAISELSEAVSHAESLEQLYEVALDTLQYTVGCDRASILLFDPDGIIRFKATRGISEAYIQRFTGHSPWHPDEKNAHPILVPDSEQWENGKKLVPEFRKEGIRALGFVPLLHQGRLLGKFMVYFDKPHQFSEEEVQLIQTVAFHVGYAIGRKQAESALLASEQRWSFALEGGGDCVWDWNLENNQVALSKGGQSMFGYTDDEIGSDISEWSSRAHPDDVPHLLEALRKFFRERAERISSEFRVRCKDGSWKWILSRGMVVHRNEEGRVTRMIGTHTDLTERKRAEETIQRQANYDPLTLLPNRRLFRDRLELEIRKAHRAGLTMGLLFIDLDNFKEVNDTLGHDRGDELLVEAAQRINQCVRESDTVARIGGDEFTVILSEVEDTRSIERVAQNIIAELVKPFVLGADKAFISASIGITLYPDDAFEVEDLLKHADQAMYVAKNAGRNRYSYFTAAMQEHAEARMRLANDLRTALEEKQFRVYYQPIVELRSGEIHKAEALIRWQHPERGMVSPMQFIPLAEENGLIREIGDWVFKQAAQQAKHLRQNFNPDFQISVNKSPVQFRIGDAPSQPNWLDHLHQLGLEGQAIAIEITESLLLDAEPEVQEKLLDFRDEGVQVAIDDFGTGYSSLAYLKKFDIDYLKIDQSFVRNLESDPENMALCEAIIVMAHKLGLKVVAEGVETEAQHDLLRSAGCDYAQGYLFSKPVPSTEFEALLREQDEQPRLYGNSR